MWRTLLYVRFATPDPTNRYYDRYDGSGSEAEVIGLLKRSPLYGVRRTFWLAGYRKCQMRPVPL